MSAKARSRRFARVWRDRTMARQDLAGGAMSRLALTLRWPICSIATWGMRSPHEASGWSIVSPTI